MAKTKHWIQKALNPATKGSFTKEAKAAGESTEQFANKVLAPGSKASTLTKRRAVFAKNLRSFNK